MSLEDTVAASISSYAATSESSASSFSFGSTILPLDMDGVALDPTAVGQEASQPPSSAEWKPSSSEPTPVNLGSPVGLIVSAPNRCGGKLSTSSASRAWSPVRQHLQQQRKNEEPTGDLLRSDSRVTAAAETGESRVGS
eukprot:CAMPEP_0178417182 /NCGR_PEP_ID=MMETSP0689_2-20121128/24443_1 /TAXON_ID=160604 /ORGANISM="Amphidinium massartii, Strain CS-259" /LENGTH=138 /DNA_ID=CAMNT_0020038541 /DNA_START=617 /DNA_END=1033 /DNA_ORIENTATION=+